MNFDLTPDEESARQLAARICADLCDEPRLRAAERDGWFHRALWRELATSGLLGAALPAEHGGAGLGLAELCLLLMEAGRHAAPVPLWPTLCLGALPIARFGSEA